MRPVRPGAAAAAAVVVAIGIVVVGNTTDRAEVVHNYRPDLPPAALDHGCFPLPHGLRFGFGYQVRRDGDVASPDGTRRRLVLQYDEVDERSASRLLAASFVRAGFVRTGFVGAGFVRSDEAMLFRRPDVGRVAAVVRGLPELSDADLVRGTIVLDLPSSPPASHDPACGESSSTKRFGEGT